MAMVRPKKHLGQHFLTDQNIALKITDQLTENDGIVVEVGPGTGILTKFLLERFPDQLKLVEIDTESAEYLLEQYPELAKNLIVGDFLRLNLNDFGAEKIAVIGNFPYNISSQIFFQLLEHRKLITEVVCMIQKEVAERLSAGPGSKTYGILSVLLQAWFSIEYVFTVHEHVFNPPPKVKSAVIKLRRNELQELGCDEVLFKKIVKQSFNQRRKTLRNSLRSLLNPTIIADERFNLRPERLSVSAFVDLTNLIDRKTTK
ncbi:MAG: 16S rRNA (adenine(1518)-N(6)/adenine(1519)-N(6))-dimethyltransferase RsmA [Bacteroidetes bacterium]|nr:16S rRNA (adenine(1518)-N(6)/adenine(1519)-N(6))-dimethyltransferase RsmA [Bacteroidota bacterium]MBU1579096.1 16S rRNA (adenine(1518)-N(6)/adenine(1519)-N(6))-dimethyltransferase RsmA [Bacteroidota bacterium]MBU2613894.1 16S rRNA (adenine(1518)-N(6)/adenine(1519)-N(6))-dimethyltransferase RsmA [Patescibacteria group bacterium]